LIDFNKIPQIEISRIFGPVGAELVHSSTQTEGGHDEENSPFARLWENCQEDEDMQNIFWIEFICILRAASLGSTQEIQTLNVDTTNASHVLLTSIV